MPLQKPGLPPGQLLHHTKQLVCVVSRGLPIRLGEIIPLLALVPQCRTSLECLGRVSDGFVVVRS